MSTTVLRAVPALLSAAISAAMAADPAPAPARLNAQQQQAVGLVVAQPGVALPQLQQSAYGLVLDPADLVSDNGRLDATRSAAAAAAADLARLDDLYRNEGNASLRALQTARSEVAQSQAQAQAAAAAFTQRWGPLATLQPTQRQALLSALLKGQRWLLRADLPGRQMLGALPQTAVLELDGLQLRARVLGWLPQTDPQLRSAGLLLQLDQAPAPLAAGTRLPVRLQLQAQSGLLLPASALIYDEHGAFVYRRLAKADAQGRQQYAPVAVKLLQAYGDAWLVSGLKADDRIVVHGAGVLWSLQGLAGVQVEDQDGD